jgi:hypothetical protein
VGGYNSTDERIWIENRISEYEPDIVISYSGMNDIGNINHDKKDIFSYVHNDALYYLVAIKEYDYYNRGWKAAEIIRDFSSDFHSPSDFPRKVLKNIKIISGYLNSIGCQYVYVLQPLNKLSDCGKGGYLPYWRSWAKTLNVAQHTMDFVFIDHSDIFDGQENIFLDSCHFGDIGNELIAGRLINELQSVIAEVIEKKA